MRGIVEPTTPEPDQEEPRHRLISHGCKGATEGARRSSSSDAAAVR